MANVITIIQIARKATISIFFFMTRFMVKVYFSSANVLGPGTRFSTGLVVFRNAKIALISVSFKFLYTNQGIGGNNGRLPFKPFDLPSRMALKNCSSVQLPIPVASELILAAYDWPHGPTAEVRSMANSI